LDIAGVNLFDGRVMQVFFSATGNPPIGIGSVQARSNATEQYNANEQGNRKIIFDHAHGMKACGNQK
jgi:hypothetical protein